ncbi:hypothetical protein [Pseudomonas parafulva]|uniref:hypothetical protein n=1 Tax=Pseudomonas parafulva TaxID=157782 RepID=UPI000733D46D|nr:hypothetical protein [Pseudomonas parafulva]KTS98306.1 hypothetical protein NS212_08710 [Pseudomonas parafulva]
MAGRYSGTQTTKTFSYLFLGARRALEAAEQEKQGQFFQVMNCLVLQAFTIEAYLNHLIEAEDHQMDISFKQARPSVWDKYEAVSEGLGLSPSKLVDAYPDVAALFEFRNSLAHGRTESISVTEIMDANEAPYRASDDQFPRWMKYCELDNARETLGRVRELIEALHEKAGLGKYPLDTLGSGIFSFSILE